MKSDMFILIPCHIEGSYKDIKEIEKDEYSKLYVKNLNKTSKSELVDRVSNSFERLYLGEYNLKILSDDYKETLEDKTVINQCKIKLFLTGCERTRLSVITIAICDFNGNPTSILDQVTREELVIQKDKLIYLEDFLFEEFGIIKNGEAKTCLIQSEKSKDEDILYYMACETNDSDLVETQIISDKYKDLALDNLAVYDFSDIYVSESVVYQVIHDKDKQAKMQYESLLIFIVELLVMKLSAIYRTNNKVQKALEENEGINVKQYEKLSNEFANTLSIWQINIYRYKGAQTIANRISERFEIDKVRDNYRENDDLLQNIIDTRNVKNSIAESKILFVVAILLFIRDLYSIIKNLYLFFAESQEFSPGDIFSSLTSILFIIIVVVIYLSRNIKIKSRKK